MTQMDSLFAEARALAAGVEDSAAAAAEAERARHVADVAAAQTKLKAALVDGLEARVREAAAGGARELELLAFEGGDTYDGTFCFLYLVRGPRQADPEIVPLLTTLRRELAPFRVRHEWKTGTVMNRVMLTWRD